MSILKDFREDHDGMYFRYKITAFLNPKTWYRLHKYRKQRCNRGWSDRDAWAAGEHIARMTAEMLQYLNDKGVVDWDRWFKDNNNLVYDNLQSIIDDINNWLNHQTTSWADDLALAKFTKDEPLETNWVDKDGNNLTEKDITRLIKKWSKEDIELYKEATKAMKFFADNFASFWE